MNRTYRAPVVALVALVLSLLTTPFAHAAARKKAQKAPPKASRQEAKARPSSSRSRGKASAKEERAEQRRERGRAGADKKSRAAQRNERASKNDRRSAREERRASSKDDDRKSGRKLSRRERLAEARREAERRRREEAARRAELARQAAIARALAIARQRAADQALRDETFANISRDDVTGEDLEVRRVAIEALGNHAGTVVVMDPKTGRVHTVVNQDWALRRGFKPCSTIKLVTGLAGLSESVIDPVQTVNVSTGSFRLDLTDSLAYSNNTYFQIVGGNVGFERMMRYARQLGLGEATGINHANESPGRVPLFKTGYAVNHMSSHGDDFEVTPIQLANMAAAISNGGSLLVPHLPRTPEESVDFKTEVRRRLSIPREHLQRLVPGMIGAVSYGTGRGAKDPMQIVAGKTGTCIGQGSWLGLFASYAPVQDPRLAVAVVTRGSGERGRIAAGVAGRIYRALNHRFGNRGVGASLLATEALAPRPKIDPSKAAAISEEDAEANAAVVSEGADASAAAGAPSSTAVGGSDSNVKSVLKPVLIRPTTTTTRPAPTSPTATPVDGRPRRVLTSSP